MILTTLVTGITAAAREAAIAATIEYGVETALILEGLPNGSPLLDDNSPHLHMARIAPGCVCCTGNLTMRVTLNRMVRRRPARLYIGLATSEHLEQIRLFLTQPPYENLLQLTKDMRA